MGKILSQIEIDNLLGSLLQDASVLPLPCETVQPVETTISAEPEMPAGIAAFKAKLAAAQEIRQTDNVT